MKENEIAFHKARRPFIIFPESGVLLGELATTKSHNDILVSMGLDTKYIKYIIKNFPRGYFKDNDLVLYQDDNFVEGNILKVDSKNIPVIKKYIYDFEKLFNIDEKTNIYLGLRVGKIGDVWDKINKISLKDLKSNLK